MARHARAETADFELAAFGLEILQRCVGKSCPKMTLEIEIDEQMSGGGSWIQGPDFWKLDGPYGDVRDVSPTEAVRSYASLLGHLEKVWPDNE